MQTDTHKTASSHHHFRTRPGSALPFGATLVPGGVNFSVFSLHAQKCYLVLFKKGENEPFADIPFPDEYRIGDVFAMQVFDLPFQDIEYGYRMEGPYQPEAGHRFDADKILLDPYAKTITGRNRWKKKNYPESEFDHRSCIVPLDFDWGHDRPLGTPIEDLIIYEMHVRSFTQHPSSSVRHPGTYAGLVEQISYLKYLGVNAVELMPVFEFDEFENSRTNPDNGELLVNYWGYGTVGFFAPKAGFASSDQCGQEVREFKAMVKALHEAGIEVILDVVFNHTAEGNENGPTISFRGIDNKTYYILTPEGYYYNFSGTGNTFNCNHPAVINFIIDSLRYWVTEYHIDGFRFDLASILARDENGAPLQNPPLLKALAYDPILGGTKLIAEPWDAGGLYHVGSYPSYGRWSEWNGKYRDSIRKFLKGDSGTVPEAILRIQGSPDLYPSRGPIASINFIIAHDGFTLADLFAYNDKHNEANLEGNRDGFNDNNSWNCGAEGPTDDPEINALRRRQMKNAMAILMMSQGVPMFMMGDETARTQHGNNNTYCQDNELNWFDWTEIEKNRDMFDFVRHLIAFRRRHPVLRHGYHLRFQDYNQVGMQDMTWYSTEALGGDPNDQRLTIAFMLGGAYAKGGLAEDDDIFVAMNMHWENHKFKLPPLPQGKTWHTFVNTGAEIPIHEVGHEPKLKGQKQITLLSRSVVILVSKQTGPAATPEAEATSEEMPAVPVDEAAPAVEEVIAPPEPSANGTEKH